MTVGDRIKLRRESLGVSQVSLADTIGEKKQTLYKYETNKITNIPIENIERIASALNTTPAYLMGWEDSALPSPDVTEDTVTFPVLVDVAAGYDRPAQRLQNWEGEKIEVPRSYLHGRNSEDYFAMRVVGDSMYPDYQDGDVLLILRQDYLDRSGQIAVVIYDGEDATLKKVEYVPGENWMKLLPINPQYPPRTITGVDLDQCRILGLPKVLVRDIK